VLIRGLPDDAHRHGVRGRSNYSAEPRGHTVIARIFALSFLGLPEPSGIDPFIPARQRSVSLIGGCWRQSTARPLRNISECFLMLNYFWLDAATENPFHAQNFRRNTGRTDKKVLQYNRTCDPVRTPSWLGRRSNGAGPVDLRSDVFWRAGKLARLFGAWLIGADVIWFLAALTCLPIGLITGWGFEGEWSAGSAMISGWVIAPVGFVLSVILFAVGQHVVDERRHWRGGRRRGIAAVHDLRPGRINSHSAAQELTCRLEIVVPGVIPRRADLSRRDRPTGRARVCKGRLLRL
jgi:hypothetical protein